MNTVKKNLDDRSGEKGIALLFTLGILTVLLVLALGFATTSITQRRNAATSVQGTVARLLAESTLERIMGTLQTYSELEFSYSTCNDLSTYPPGTPSENRGTTDLLYRLQTAETDVINTTNYPYISWEYVTVDDAGTPKIIGRVAYVIVFNSAP